jgi:hypothetical protein
MLKEREKKTFFRLLGIIYVAAVEPLHMADK